MDINQFVTTAQDAITVRRVFAEPYEKNGTTVITAARVTGGGGGGVGPASKDGAGSTEGTGTAEGEASKNGEAGPRAVEGEGVGFGLNATPAGAFVIKDGAVRWIPAIDPNRLFAAVAAVVVAVVVTRGWVVTRAIKAGRVPRD